MARGTVMSALRRLVDSILLRVRSRLEHLELHAPSTTHERQLREAGAIDATTRLFPGARFVTLHPGQLTIGEHCYIQGEIVLVSPDARCAIGHDCSFGKDSRIWVHDSVTIGNFVLIAHMVDIHDNNSHSLDWRDRREDAMNVFRRGAPIDVSKVPSAPVVIEDDVWIGAKSTILKGVRIGRGAVVAANSVVTENVEPFTLVAGNPARVVRQLDVPKS
jgi:acetyltransferase-like isoleucine patch superfamily enzyme